MPFDCAGEGGEGGGTGGEVGLHALEGVDGGTCCLFWGEEGGGVSMSRINYVFFLEGRVEYYPELKF